MNLLLRGGRPFLALALPIASLAAAQETSRVSVTAAGGQSDGYSSRPSMSADGRWIGYYSLATNLVPGDTNGVEDVFLYDRLTGAVERISESSAGAQGNAPSVRASVSADGAFVGFYSDANNLVAGDTNAARDCFVRDRVAGTTVRVSVSTSGVQGNARSERPVLSATGRFVVFQSDATNLVSGDTNAVRDVFLHDRDTDEDGIFDEPGAISTVRVSVSSGGAQANAEAEVASVTEDGRFVAFRSVASNLVGGDTNGVRDVFVRDTLLGTTVRVSLSTGGAQGNQDSSRPFMSADGRYVTFYSLADNLVPGDTNLHCYLDPFGQLVCEPAGDVFVRDRDTDEDGVYDEPGAVKTVRVSVSSGGGQGNDRSEDPDISPDGRYVVFWSEATNLVSGDTNDLDDIFLHDRDVDEDGVFDEPGAILTERVSVSTAGAQANAECKRPAVAANGRFVVFRSKAGNLIGGDTNATGDIFLRDRCTPNCQVGVVYCSPAEPNSSGQPALISALGSESVSKDDLTLHASQLPANKFGYFLVSAQQGFVQNPGGSQGNLCLAGQIGRYAKSILNSGAGGTFSMPLDMTDLPSPLPGGIQPGETWNFQSWFRDKNPDNTSNFTDGLRIDFAL